MDEKEVGMKCAQALHSAGVDFVPVPVVSAAERAYFFKVAKNKLDQISESFEAKDKALEALLDEEKLLQ